MGKKVFTMKIRGILAIIFSMSLALFAGNALADSKSGSHAKSEKSSMPGNGYGHCKRDLAAALPAG